MASQPLNATASDGTKLFVQDWGSGKPVLLLAAWTFNSSVWGSQIVALNAKGFRCVAPDRRGHGRSDMPMTGYDLDTLTDDVAAVKMLLGDEQFNAQFGKTKTHSCAAHGSCGAKQHILNWTKVGADECKASSGIVIEEQDGSKVAKKL